MQAHEFFSTKLTWTRDISRIFYKRCASCHREGGSSFALTTYEQARPWAKAIKDEVLNRRMPPWNAMKGFGDLYDDKSLTQEEISVISSWVEGGAPEGEKVYEAAVPKLQDGMDAGPTAPRHVRARDRQDVGQVGCRALRYSAGRALSRMPRCRWSRPARTAALCRCCG